MGVQIWGRSTEALSTPRRPVPRENWVISNTRFEPIVSKELFDRAQTAFAELTHRLTKEEMLEKLRRIIRTQHWPTPTRPTTGGSSPISRRS